MTENTETTETTTTETTEETTARRRDPNAEAAKYRTRLRETEAERDAATEATTAAEERAAEAEERAAAAEREVLRWRAIAEHHVPEEHHHLVRGDSLDDMREVAAALSQHSTIPGVVRLSGVQGDTRPDPMSWRDALSGGR